MMTHDFCQKVTCYCSCICFMHNGTSTTIFLNWSMHVMMVPYPLSSGSSITKSMWIYSHGVFRYFQQLVQSCQFPGIHFEELALLKFLTIHSYCIGHPWPIELLPYHLLSMLLAKMSSGIMVFIKNGRDQTFKYVQSPFEGKKFS